ncbi:hypothetical protein D3C80_601760 [compost metagenome]
MGAVYEGVRELNNMKFIGRHRKGLWQWLADARRSLSICRWRRRGRRLKIFRPARVYPSTRSRPIVYERLQ